MQTEPCSCWEAYGDIRAAPVAIAWSQSPIDQIFECAQPAAATFFLVCSVLEKTMTQMQTETITGLPNLFQQHAPKIVLLRRPAVEQKTGLARSTIYKLMALGKFPKPVQLTKKAIAWPSNVIDAWIDETIANDKVTP